RGRLPRRHLLRPRHPLLVLIARNATSKSGRRYLHARQTRRTSMHTQIDTMNPGEVISGANEALDHLDRAEGSMPFTVSLTSERRQTSGGKFRDDEEVAVGSVADTVE